MKGSLIRIEELKDIVIAADLMTDRVVSLPAYANLEEALHLFESFHISCIPVTEPENRKSVLGILKKDDLLQAYQEKVLKNRILSTS